MRNSRGTTIRNISTRFSFVLLSFVVAGNAAAQAPVQRDGAGKVYSELARRSSAGLSFIQTHPQGSFGKNIGPGYGVNGSYLFRIDRTGVLSVRADLAAVAYGNDVKRTALSESVGDRVQVNLRTTNYMVPISVGPQLARPTGMVRPYVNVGVGGQWFLTESAVENSDAGNNIASTSNQSTFSTAWTSGAGIYVPINTIKRNVQFDVGVKYVNGSQSEYLAPGSITDLPNGQIKIAPMQSNTHYLILHVGAKIGL